MGGDKQQFSELKSFIENSWAELTVSQQEETVTHFPLPNSFVAPSVHRTEGFVFKEQFYWDTYFTMVGLASSGKKDLALGMVDNLLSLQDRLGYIPNSNNKSHGGRSQPPFLSSMVLAGYVISRDRSWLEGALVRVEAEYHKVWVASYGEGRDRVVHEGLSRYMHHDMTHRGAEEESGWDYTNRFDGRAMDFLPIDLNSLLFKYESDIAAMNEMLGRPADEWYSRAHKRQKSIDKTMWNDDRGMYFDYDFVNGHRSPVASLAAYLPMFVGMASPQQARELVGNLALFKTAHGLTTTVISDTDHQSGHQWMSPNGWAPLHFLVVEGLKRYGYDDQAREIARCWVETVNRKFIETGQLHEKYNVVNPDQNPVSAVYPDQVGFGWTNAITLHFMNSYID